MKDPGLTGNFITEGTASFGAIYLDAIPFEANNVRGFNWGDRELLYRRFIAMEKPMIVVHTEAEIDIKDPMHREGVEHFIEECLFYGALAQFRLEHYQNSEFIEAVGELLEREAEISHELMQAGWKPITMARGEPSSIWVERYGDLPVCFFTVYNSGKQETKSSLIIEFEADVVEIWKGKEVSLEKAGNLTKVTFTLSPREIIVLKTMAGGIDISIKDLRFEGELKPNQNVQITADFLVQGQEVVDVEVALVVDGIVEDSRIISLSNQGSITFNWSVKPGKHLIEIIVDPSDEIAEINEDNNRVKITLSVPSFNIRWVLIALAMIFLVILVLVSFKLGKGP